jgi:hypothetical protein
MSARVVEHKPDHMAKSGFGLKHPSDIVLLFYSRACGPLHALNRRASQRRSQSRKRTFREVKQ